ncbi:hypothetical protein DYH09_26210 [bacterium CPR1]|nr:hypothetical protein [bacterium CPR1]
MGRMSDSQPTEIYSSGVTLLESIHQARNASTTPLPGYQVTVEVPAAMIGGLSGYVVNLVSNQEMLRPTVRDAEVIPEGNRGILTLSLDGPVPPEAQVWLTTATGQAYAPTMLAVLPEEEAPPPPRPELAHLAAISPVHLNPPEDVLAALRQARKVLVVCHTPPDGDTAGSGLGLRRTLEALGKEADLLLDGDLPGWMRQQAEPGEFKSFEEVQHQDYDLVVVVDVAQAHRIGRAAEMVGRAQQVVVLDHHDGDPSPESLGMQGQLAKWIAPTDATALLVAAVAEKLAPSRWEGIAPPLVTGILTDTQLFQKPVRGETGPILKYLLEKRGGGALEQACRRVESPLADEARGLLMEPMRFKGVLLSPEGEAPRQAALTQQQSYHEELSPGLALMVVSAEAQKLATSSGKLADPETNLADLQDAFFARLDQLAGELPVAVMLWEQPDHIHIAIRSQDPARASELAHTLGGGGKPGLAAAHPRRPLPEVLEIVRGWSTVSRS